MEPEQLSRYSDWLRAGRSGDVIPVGVTFFASVHTGSGAHPASYKMGTGYLYRGKATGGGVAFTTHLQPEPRLKKEYSYTSPSSLALHGLFQSDLYLCLYKLR